MTEDRMWVGDGADPDFEIRRKSGRISAIARKDPDPDPDSDPDSTDRIKELIGKLKTLRSAPDLPRGYGQLIDEILDELESSIREGSSEGPDGPGKKSAWVVPDSEFHEAPKPRAPALRGLANFETAKKAVPLVFKELELARLQAGVREVEVAQKKLRSDLQRSDREAARQVLDRVTKSIEERHLKRGRAP